MSRLLSRRLVERVRTLVSWLAPAASPPPGDETRSRRAFRPRLERLEEREVPTVTFGAPQTFALGTNPYLAAASDFNGDGRPDLAFVNANSATVSVLLNTAGAGANLPSFAAQKTFAVGGGLGGVAVADFNGDGRLDLAVANSNTNNVSVLLNTTVPGSSAVTFAAQATFATGGGPVFLAAGDLNGDGLPDLAVANYGSGNGSTLSVLLNTATVFATTPSFAAAQTFAVGTGPLGVAVADFNGDGMADVAVANYGSGGVGATVSVLLNTTPALGTTASFTTQSLFTVGVGPAGVVAADFNGDGRPDVAVASYGPNGVGSSVSVLLNNAPQFAGLPSFAAQQVFATGSGPFALAAADINGDGRPDLVAGDFGAGANGTLTVLEDTTPAGGTTPAFASGETVATGTGLLGVAVADFNADGRNDLAVSSFGGNGAAVLLSTTTPYGTTVPVVVGQFANNGVWEYNRSTGVWTQMTAANASLLAADAAGDVAGVFPGAGVWLYRPSAGTWVQINGFDATALTMDGLGNVFATFHGTGVARYVRFAGGWGVLTGAEASILTADAVGDLYGEFPGAGVWRYQASLGWDLVNGVDATALAVNASGVLAAAFTGYGLATFTNSVGWMPANGYVPSALAIGARGELAAFFGGFGLGEYYPSSGWASLTTSNALTLGVDANGNVIGGFGGLGVWEFDPYRGWVNLTAGNAALQNPQRLVVA
jgi:hypothetical protein